MSDFDLTGAMPFDRDADDSRPGVLAVPGPFLYLGTGLTAQAFAAYVASYNFGRIHPSYIVLHHTAIPSTLAARYPTGAVWDAGEQGMSEARIYQKRTKQLDALANYYQDSLGWDRGPHLFIDEKYVWLFTPMNAIGIHAKEGNSYTAGGRLHYSIGIEVIGYYENTPWPKDVATNVRSAAQALCSRLGIAPVYRPGPLHTPSAHNLSVSSHRDYNKPQCPGAAITDAYYTSVIAADAPTPKAYRVRGVPVYQAESLTGKVAGWLESGRSVTIDKTYPNGAGHMIDPPLGFVDMDALE